MTPTPQHMLNPDVRSARPNAHPGRRGDIARIRPVASPKTKIVVPFQRVALAFALCGALSACSLFASPPQLRGNKVDPEALAELTPGTSTRADVTALIGSPTTKAAFDDNTWIYISELTQPQVGRFPAVVDQTVLVLTFTDQGVLSGVEKKTKDDSLSVDVVTRTTPSPGTEASFMQQLFGNIGRFNALGTSAQGGGGGSGSGGGGSRGGAPTPY